MRYRRSILLSLLVVLVASETRAAPVTCPDGEITLSTDVLTGTRNGEGNDRFGAPSNHFTLPAGVAIEGGESE